jgi:hypothetical protein
VIVHIHWDVGRSLMMMRTIRTINKEEAQNTDLWMQQKNDEQT